MAVGLDMLMEHEHFQRVVVVAINQNPFWTHPTDVNPGVKIRNQINKLHFATEQYMDFYFHYRANEQKSNLPDEQDKL